MPFQLGDVFELRSGGPQMTVTGTSQSGWVMCSWFKDGKYESGTFPPEALEKPRKITF